MISNSSNFHLQSMKTYLIGIFLLCVASYTMAQDKKDLAISFSTGYFNSPYYKNAHKRAFYEFSTDYHLSKKHILSVDYLAGKHDYLDEILSNTPPSQYLWLPKGTNAEAIYSTFSVMYKFKIVDTKKFSIVPGAGAGILTHSRTYPYSTSTSLWFDTSSWSDLVFPVTLDVNYKLSMHWQIGLTSGFLIHPDFPILGLHLGPKLSYIIK